MLGAGNDAQWRRFCAAARLDDFVEHPDLATNALRVKNMAFTVSVVQEKMATKTVGQWVELLSAANVPCSPIHTLGQALEHPQVASRGLVVQSEHPVLGTVRNIGLPVRFQHEDRTVVRPPPLLGEHSAEVLRGLGYDDGRIASLLAERVITAQNI
jgi:crotonobetainyl-CoA:carnitine CoA-transferase CaiB-like acyl-CoA transferase